MLNRLFSTSRTLSVHLLSIQLTKTLKQQKQIPLNEIETTILRENGIEDASSFKVNMSSDLYSNDDFYNNFKQFEATIAISVKQKMFNYSLKKQKYF